MTTLPELPAEARRRLEQFDETWADGRMAEFVRGLPPPGDPGRLPALAELVRIDLKHQWARGRKPRVEGYVHCYPELGPPAAVPDDVILAEYQARQRAGAALDPADLGRRFPAQAERVLGRLLAGAATPPATAPPNETLPTPAAAASGELAEQFGHYRILKKLGQGGMGTVYLARDQRLDRPVALKVPRFLETGGALLDRFYQEVKSAATLDHPNICPVYEVSSVGDTHYMAMAYVEGRSLSDLVRPGQPWEVGQAVQLVRKLALVVHEAHQQGVVHRDLKPANVMINKRKEPIIMDFGLARRTTEDGTRLTADGSVMGTPAYMAPEQARGDRDAMGPGCDVYALGVLLYELLTGTTPFGGSIAEILTRVLCDDPDRPSMHRAGLDPRLDEVCLKALAKSPEQRYASARDLAEALGPWLPPAVPTMAAPPGGAVSAATPPRPSLAPAGGGESRAGPGAVRCPSCGRTYALAGQPAGRSARCRGCGQKFQVRTVGRFQVLDEIGRGGFGVVYRVFDPKMDREAAVKVLHADVAQHYGSGETLRRFRNEAKVLAQIVHPNILPLYEADQHEGQLYLVTALIRGRRLDELVPPGGLLDPRRAVALMVPLLEALHYVHTTYGVCHRDVKPANVMVGDGDALYLMDFGLAACATPEGSRVTTDGTTLGTPAYMPPEQAEGNLAQVGPWSDQYSAGVVLFHLLTGQVPFRKPLPAILGEIVTAPPPRPTSLRPDLGPEMDALLLKALAKSPQARHRDCREFADLLRDWSAGRRPAGGGGAAPAAPAPPPKPATAARLPAVAWAVALGAVLTAALLGTGAYLLFGSKPAPPPATRPAGQINEWQGR